jgi:N-acetylglucosamine repressor
MPLVLNHETNCEQNQRIRLGRPKGFMNINPVANLDSVKQHNLARIFKIIVEYGLISRTQLADVSKMAAGSVTKLTRLLIEQGLVHEVDHIASERGRKAVLLAPKSDDIQILAARADRDFIYIGLCDLSGNLLHRISVPLKASTENAFVAQITKTLQRFLDSQKEIIKHIIGLGITMTGIVSPEEKMVFAMPKVSINQLKLAEILEKELNLPCHLNNFSSAMALAEKQLGASFHAENSLFVEVHDEVSAGLIVNNRLVSNLGVGEIGHIQIDPNGKLCECGNYGCLETLVSNDAIVAAYNERTEQPSKNKATIQDILDLADASDTLALEVLTEAAQYLGTVLSNVVNLLRPEVIIIAGEITQAWSAIEPVLYQQLASRSIQIPGIKQVTLLRSELYESPWYSGYALVREALLSGELLPNLLRDEQPVDMSKF